MSRCISYCTWGFSSQSCMFSGLYTLRIQVCAKKGITPTFLFFSDGIGTQNILFEREGSGFLGISYFTPIYNWFWCHLPGPFRALRFTADGWKKSGEQRERVDMVNIHPLESWDLKSLLGGSSQLVSG